MKDEDIIGEERMFLFFPTALAFFHILLINPFYQKIVKQILTNNISVLSFYFQVFCINGCQIPKSPETKQWPRINYIQL